MAKKGELKGKEQEIIRLYATGESILTLATRFNVCSNSILGVIKKYSKVRTISESLELAHKRGRFRFAGINRRVFDYNEATRLYNEGLSSGEVAERLGVKAETVSQFLTKAKISRTVSDANKLARDKGRWKAPIQKKGDKSHNWKGGRRLHNGYIYVYAPDHPRASKRSKIVAEHILVWEQVNNKLLPNGWVVHHLNGIKNDNRPINLVGLPRTKHSLVLQAKAKRIQELEALLRGQNQLI